ncbi:PrgI family protein [Candidatus Daviesbacteria bacterium]|nr:PrgI family protein [Candidatus Daviesbacteria bacterium]
MEPHPIPQNVTSFQFRLIGDMTLKQFLYLATGVGLAYLMFVFLAAPYPYLAWPLIVLSALSGVAFAFLPIGSRPLDHWFAAFIKAIYSPTKRSWIRAGKSYFEDPLFGSRLLVFTSGPQMKKVPEEPTPPTPQLSKPVSQLPTGEELQKTVDLAKQAQDLQLKIIQTERTLGQIRAEATKPTPIPVDYSQQVNKILADLKNMITQASAVKEKLENVSGPPEPSEKEPPKEKVKVVIPIRPKIAQVALTTFPNVINGVVKDTVGNYLEGVVAVIYDKEGLPVRALKTNKLGQFSGSTPLPNGIYTLELEKENFAFDVLQIELTGSVLPPINVVAKS